MGLSLKALRERKTSVEIEAYGETLIVDYDPTRFTPEFRSNWFLKAAELDAANDAARKAATESGKPFNQSTVYRSNIELMLELVSGWNLLGMDETPVPLELEVIMAQVPEVLITRITSAIWADVRSLGKPMIPATSRN